MKSRYAFRFMQLALIVWVFAGALGCANCNKKTETKVSRPGEIMMKASEVFSNAPGLTVDQKHKLAEVYRKVFADAMQVRKEIFENKSELFTAVAQVDYNSKQVDRLKAKIVELDQKRLVLMFKALADVQAIVGYGKDKEEIYRHLREYEHLGHSATLD